MACPPGRYPVAEGGNTKMAEMTKRERVQAALAGKMVDRMPVAFWRHWPMDDQNAESLARVALDFYHRYDFDFIKITIIIKLTPFK